jgi:hypothetical protein
MSDKDPNNAVAKPPQEVTKAVKSNPDSNKIVISIITSLAVAILAMVLISMELIPAYLSMIIIPASAYALSLLMSSIYQYSMCNNLSIGAIALSNIFILLTTGLASFFLFLEKIPVLKMVFGPYPPRNPISGLPYSEGTEEYNAGMLNENHYKIQFFSSIVKAVLPVYLSEPLKEGFISFYWIFWMTILPLFFLLSVQGICK